MSATLASIRTRGVRHRPTAPVLEVKDVLVAYPSGAVETNGQAVALDRISFQVDRGQRVAVVGPNGAGKSTLLKLIAGLLQASQGTVAVYGYGPDDHICIGYIPQRNQIDWTFPVTVAEVVMMGRIGKIGLFRWPKRRDWDLVHRSLARVNATHLAKKQIGELSGGQQQRVFIARALAQEAELLLLDEPLAGLDIPSQEAIFDILDGLPREDVTVLLATHDLQMAAERFDLALLLNRRIVAFGRPETALASDKLMAAYGGYLHILHDGGGTVVLADTCCDHGEASLAGRWSPVGGVWSETEKLEDD